MSTVERPAQTVLMPRGLEQCIHCGFCLPACPTYSLVGREPDSPRGRLHFIAALYEGRVEPVAEVAEHLDLCLQCRACEPACPAGVPYGSVMEEARSWLLERRRAPRAWRIRAALLRQTVAHRTRLRVLFTALRLYQRYGLRSLVRKSGVLRWFPQLARGEAALPELPARPFGLRLAAEPRDNSRGTVGMLSGCVAPYLYPRTHAATAAVLSRLGYRVLEPAGQTCCGALSLHAGDRRYAQELARRNIDAFLDAGVDAVIADAAGCGAAMKEYGALLAGDATYAEKAARFAASVRDVLQFVAALPFADGLGPLPKRVTYQDSCHLAHAQREKAAPRTILRAIPGLRLVEMAGSDRCCGSAGIYTIAQPQIAAKLLEEKMDAIEAAAVDIIATANIGCMMQLELGVRQRAWRTPVMHVIELLDASYQAGDSGG